MFYTIKIIGLYLIPAIISFWAVRNIEVNGTDQYYHNLLISTIRDAGNKMVFTMPNFIGENIMGYPQFLHWLLSYFPRDKVRVYGKYMGSFFNILSSLSLAWFIYSIHPYLTNYGIGLSMKDLYFLAGLIFVFTPYNYDMINAKNAGISARGFGLFLGQLYLYLLILHQVSDNIGYLLFAIPVVILIYMSSTFAIQFVLFSIIPLVLLYQDIQIALPAIGGGILFYLIKPKIFKALAKGQWNHKKLYAQHLAPIFILNARRSIWSDFVYGFWKKLFDKDISFFDKIKYISSNSVMVVLSSMPAILFVCYLWSNNYSFVLDEHILWYFSVPILTSMILFVATSYRRTRFLGEPERYMEFSIGFMGVFLAAFYWEYTWMIFLIISVAIPFILLRFFVYKKALENDEKAKSRQEILAIKATLEKLSNDSQQLPKVFCNGMSASTILMSRKLKTFWHPLFQPKIGNYHFTDLYSDNYQAVNEHKILSVADDFEVDYLVVEKAFAEKLTSKLIKQPQKFNLLTDTQYFQLYKICPEN